MSFNVALAAVSCSPTWCRLGGAGLGFWLTGKLGRAWVGAWVQVNLIQGEGSDSLKTALENRGKTA